ncbi:AMP-binding protein [Altericista sp. CCNU0014]|uniref:AMP-binding protein n=1 Tax=Altericista sp. CCNU0014 TaxID=3082949 RepID=UPI00384A51F8
MNELLTNTLPKTTVIDILRHRASCQSELTGYTFLTDGETQSVSLTYQAIDLQARAIAARLQSLKAGGSRALLLYPAGLEFITAFFGCLYAGVTAVPAYPPQRHQSKHRLQAIVSDAQAAIALTTTSLQMELRERVGSELGLDSLRWIATDAIDVEDASNWQSPPLGPNDLALLQYTSGTTGKPKGVAIAHQNLLHNAAMIQHSFQDTANSTGVSWLPMYHDMGLIGGVLQPLYVGRPMVLMSPTAFIQKPIRWLQAISRYRASTSGGPNFAYDLCIQKIRAEQKTHLDLTSWRIAFSGAESIRAKTLEAFARHFKNCGFDPAAFHPCYGMAEATLMISSKRVGSSPTILPVNGVALEQNRIQQADPNAASARAIVGCGDAWLDQKVAIVDPVTLKPCSAHTVGEIWVSSPSVAQGYWRRSDESKFAFDAHFADSDEGPFLRTGDLGFIQNGELFVTGRLKDVVIIRGRNHYPQDIEWTVQSSHHAFRVGHSAAFSIAVDGIERLVIHQEIDRQALRALDADGAMRAIRQAISEEHQLQVYAIALLKPGTLPKTSSGKVQRNACKTAFLAGELASVAEWRESSVDVGEIQQSAEAMLEKLRAGRDSQQNHRARTAPDRVRSEKHQPTPEEIRCWMVANLAMYLNVKPDDVDVSDPFSQYGLDSSVALSLTSELSTWIDKELEPTIFWEYPSIEALAHYLGER